VAQQESRITPFWKGVITGVAAIVVWQHRGWILGAVGRLVHFRGPSDGVEISGDPSIAVRQMRRYAFAASQDKSPIVGITHASYALIALDIIEEAVGRDAIKAKGYDPAKLRAFITGLQDMHAKRLEACDPYLVQTLAMERGDPNGQLPGQVFAGVEYSAPTGA
jgi:hypothetical protein